jgi:hypothetical protein
MLSFKTGDYHKNLKIRKENTILCKVSGYGLNDWVRFSAGEILVSSPLHPDRLLAHPASIPMGAGE